MGRSPQYSSTPTLHHSVFLSCVIAYPDANLAAADDLGDDAALDVVRGRPRIVIHRLVVHYVDLLGWNRQTVGTPTYSARNQAAFARLALTAAWIGLRPRLAHKGFPLSKSECWKIVSGRIPYSRHFTVR